MPTSTFFRLPEEKRARLIEAAWGEFMRTRFADASINRIIHSARIPRGSFYQYFADKEELFQYLLGGTREYFIDTLVDILREVRGDLFALPLTAFDRFISRGGDPDPTLSRCIQMMKANPGMDPRWLMTEQASLIPEQLLEQMDITRLRRKDREFVDHVFFLVIAPLAYAIMETLRKPEQWERQRMILSRRIEIIQYGSLDQAAGERQADAGISLR